MDALWEAYEKIFAFTVEKVGEGSQKQVFVDTAHAGKSFGCVCGRDFYGKFHGQGSSFQCWHFE